MIRPLCANTHGTHPIIQTFPCKSSVLSTFGRVAIAMFFQEGGEIAKKAAKPPYRDENGTAVDISCKPPVGAGMRAKRRTQRLREEDGDRVDE